MNIDQIVNELEKVSDFGINLLNSARENGVSIKAVSYTHLTLPTSIRV